MWVTEMVRSFLVLCTYTGPTHLSIVCSIMSSGGSLGERENVHISNVWDQGIHSLGGHMDGCEWVVVGEKRTVSIMIPLLQISMASPKEIMAHASY